MAWWVNNGANSEPGQLTGSHSSHSRSLKGTAHFPGLKWKETCFVRFHVKWVPLGRQTEQFELFEELIEFKNHCR